MASLTLWLQNGSLKVGANLEANATSITFTSGFLLLNTHTVTSLWRLLSLKLDFAKKFFLSNRVQKVEVRLGDFRICRLDKLGRFAKHNPKFVIIDL